MKNFELSDSISNLLVLTAVVGALLPFVLGDRLILIVGSLMREGGVLIDQLSAFVLSLL